MKPTYAELEAAINAACIRRDMTEAYALLQQRRALYPAAS